MAPSSTVERFYDLYGTSSSDSGKTWTPNHRVSDRSRDVGAVDDAYFTRVEMDSSTVGHAGSGPTAADALWAGVGAGGILCIAGLALIVVSQRRRSAE